MTDDTLTPHYTSSKRQSNIIAATFNLTATILGGGVLSLPLAFEKCGLILGSLLMVLSMVITERSLFLLCICARISGATTYGEVGKAAFGTKGEYGISIVLFVYLMFVTVAFMILVQDIWSSIFTVVTRQAVNQNLVLLVVLVLMSPFFVQRSLHALRFNCYIGFASIPILLLAIGHDVFTGEMEIEPLQWTSSFNDVLYAFPIINLSFLCVFNVLPVQAALIEPSRKRMQLVIDGAIGFAIIIMVPFGILGYMYSGENTSGNILNNIPAPNDFLHAGGIGTKLFFLGRLGCGVTLTLAMPLMLLPCRATLREILDVAIFGPHIVEPHPEKLPLLASRTSSMFQSERSVKDPVIVTKRNERRLNENSWVRYLLTFLILGTCYLVAIRVPEVAIVWSLVGSSMAFLIAFILPAACYMKIQQDSHFPNDESTAWLWFAQGLFVLSVIAVVACTAQSIIRLL